ncbi:hypothetical protein N7492_006890 [Penicillium capsulatum]|uniref:Uncharacterized protein n=1 Tax=Penicillium capsulatum TaxID=69766 RepID=A0A9W9HYV1_9EURO|nr:hypothetical protein N7492_006890 [Penicillium capsulatum]KAJ6116724.1 hypothetical protein N7512_006449 [Penicillium capsulatum]
MDANYANPASLAELSSLVERTLLDTGRLFRKSASMPASFHVQRSVPAYHDRFQNALDSLSEQIFIAKAFLEKDYEAIKAREALPQSADMEMKDVDHKVESVAQPATPEKTEATLDTEPVKTEAKPDDGIALDVPKSTEAIPDLPAGEGVATGEAKEATNTGSADQLLTGATDGLNFDSVLNEAGGSNSFNLSLDFGDDDMGNQAFLSGSAFGNNAAPEGGKPETSQAPESTTAPAGGDAFDMELQKTEGDPFPEDGNAMDDIMGPGESSFDDLFMETENLGDGSGDMNQLEGDSLMNLNELDDSWFM